MYKFKNQKIMNERILNKTPNFEGIITKCDEKIMFVTNNIDVPRFDILLSLLIYIENVIISDNTKFTTEQLLQLALQLLSITKACDKKGE
jgi:hypothetical protein|nr:MAG TPA_asm: hypothetical protein [Caudoviricetes sp.]